MIGIKGIMLPIDCNTCPCAQCIDYDFVCGVTGEETLYAPDGDGNMLGIYSRLDSCPLVELKEDQNVDKNR